MKTLNARRVGYRTYCYDPVGNFQTLKHSTASGGWKRTYAYDEPNLIPTNNHLTSTTVGDRTTDTYGIPDPTGWDPELSIALSRGTDPKVKGELRPGDGLGKITLEAGPVVIKADTHGTEEMGLKIGPLYLGVKDGRPKIALELKLGPTKEKLEGTFSPLANSDPFSAGNVDLVREAKTDLLGFERGVKETLWKGVVYLGFGTSESLRLEAQRRLASTEGTIDAPNIKQEIQGDTDTKETKVLSPAELWTEAKTVTGNYLDMFFKGMKEGRALHLDPDTGAIAYPDIQQPSQDNR